jgi:hypothetical protein
MSREQQIRLTQEDLMEVLEAGRNAEQRIIARNVQVNCAVDAYVEKTEGAKTLSDAVNEDWRRSFFHNLNSYIQGERQNARVMGTYWINMYERYTQ